MPSKVLTNKSLWLMLGLSLLALAPFLGSERIAFTDLFSPGCAGYRVLWELRLPRLAVTLLVGGSLAILGGTYQVLFHNPLAEPYLLGISSGVTLAIACGEVFLHLAPYSYWATALGFGGALVVTSLLVLLSLSSLGDALDRIVLFGTGVNFLLSATLFLLLSYSNQQMGGGSMRWIFGQIPWLSGREAGILLAVGAPFLAFLFVIARSLDALSLGDTVARTLGVAPVRQRALIVCVTSAFLSVLVAFTGAIGFVGLIIPHAVRLLFRPATTRSLFGYCFVIGAAFLSLSDVLSRALLPPFEFPIGVMTTVIGTPFFLYLLWKH